MFFNSHFATDKRKSTHFNLVVFYLLRRKHRKMDLRNLKSHTKLKVVEKIFRVLFAVNPEVIV